MQTEQAQGVQIPEPRRNGKASPWVVRSGRRAVGALVLAVTIGGCTNLAPAPVLDPTSVNAIEQELAAAVAAERSATRGREAAARASMADVLVPPLVVSDDPAFAERFDLSVNSMPAGQFFRGLVAGTAFNMVVHPNVSGDVSLDLKKVTLDEVMELMREVYGYDYTRSGSIFRVYPDALRTELFQVDYLDVTRAGTSEMHVSTGTISDANSNSSGGNNNRDRGDDRDNQNNSRSGGGRGGSVVGTSVNTTSRSDFWANLGETIEVIIGDEAGARVVVTPHTGLVVVRARPEGLRAVRAYLDEAQLTLSRQVILEAKILEVTLNSGFESGIDWHTFGEQALDSFDPVNGAGGSNNDVAAELKFGSSGSLFNPIGSSFAFNFRFGDFEGIVSLLSTQGNVQVLSSPRIATVNNQKAVIKVGSDEFFVTDISTSTVTAGSSINVNDSPELTPFFSGIALDVTPQIGRGGDVTLHIHPSVSEVTEQRKNISGESVPLAASTIRESDSIVRAMSGEVIVIGGLMQNTSRDNNASVPGLGRLPVLGHAFNQKQQRTTKSELVILLKPMVVTGESERDALQQSLESVRRLQQALSGGRQ